MNLQFAAWFRFAVDTGEPPENFHAPERWWQIRRRLFESGSAKSHTSKFLFGYQLFVWG
jgi:hypothetical protein